MTRSKNQNSILLLTTLGVYIGLLMAGAAPGVIAGQAAAMTRNFELSEEIEVRDDLDLDPAVSADENDLERTLLSPSAVSILRVYLTQFTPDIAHVVEPYAAAGSTPSARGLSTPLPAPATGVLPNDVRRSSNFTSASLPRASLS